MKDILSGNQAIARGAYEYGVKVAAGYPGTPSTEILENLSKYDEVYTEWAPNEKVALEVAIGAAFTGVRTMATMKHVGLNVAADPLMTSSYTGIEGGLLVVVADDPGMHSSQNEQDSRNYAKFAKVPLFEPSDAAEAKELVKDALEISEQFDTPVIFRSNTRISHSKGVVELEERKFQDRTPAYKRNSKKYLMIPSYARKRRLIVEDRIKKLKAFANEYQRNKTVYRDKKLGIITSSISYQYVMEIFQHASILKLTMSYPFPDDLILDFSKKVKNLIVIEELDRFITEHVHQLGIKTVGDNLVPNIGELDPDIVSNIKNNLSIKGYYAGVEIKDKEIPQKIESPENLPARPPVLCPGCPHRTVFYTLRRAKAIIMGDIGCYSLGGLPPLDSMDAIICMGAGISAAMGISKSGIDRPVVGIVGDSTFFHSGITGLLDIGYNKGNLTIIVLDNRITAMTGHQEHPGTGKTLKGEDTIEASIEKFAIASGIDRIKVFDPYDVEATKKTLLEEIRDNIPSILISRKPCALLKDAPHFAPYQVNPEKCTSCGICLKIACPAIEKRYTEGDKWVAYINEPLCTGCSVCAQVCPFDAIYQTNKKNK